MSVLALAVLAALAGSPASEDHAARRARLGRELGAEGVAVVFAPDRVTDAANPFAGDPSFFYLTGRLETGAVLVLDPDDAEQAETLYLEERSRDRERWTGARLGPGDVDPVTGEPDAERQAAMAATGIQAVRPRADLDARLTRLAGRGKVVHVTVAPGERGAPLSRPLTYLRDLRERVPWLHVKPLAGLLTDLRVIKSGAELASIERAVAITLAAQRAVARALRPGLHEYEATAILEHVFARSGASGPAFPSIVGSGMNGTVLHHTGGAREMTAGDLVVIDIGARFEGYAADVTRTYPVTGRFNAAQRALYEVVLRAQDAALARVKPGARLRSDVHAAAKRVIDDAGHGKHFPHGTSHHVGLEVHDVGERDGVLAAGMVITVEPGIYLADQALGIRIEDMVVVTENGYRLLTRELPRSVTEVEALVGDSGEPEPRAVVQAEESRVARPDTVEEKWR